MILYHGSDVEVKFPKILHAEQGRDFGPAFYLTPIKEQAEKMALRRKAINKSQKAVVSVFDWDEKTDLSVKNYIDSNQEWLDMVITCRKNAKYKHQFDVVRGKIADDNVGVTINFVIKGYMRKEDALKRLKFNKINEQVAFCSEKSLTALKFLESYEV